MSEENSEVQIPQTEDEMAIQLYQTYNNQGPNPWTSFSGQPVPQYQDAGAQVQGKWKAVARYVATLRKQ